MEYLYHGTFDEEYESILKDGVITYGNISEATETINEVINIYGEEDIREGCIYLSSDSDSTHAYDYAFKISIDKLNKKLLLVADHNLVDNIYSSMCSGKHDEKYLKDIVDRYMDSVIYFEDYISVKEEYDSKYFPEFMYFGDIKVSEEDTLID